MLPASLLLVTQQQIVVEVVQKTSDASLTFLWFYVNDRSPSVMAVMSSLGDVHEE